MKKTICLFLQAHIPFYLRQYRFFDIGNSHEYYDDFKNRNYVREIAESCYLPVNEILLDLIKKHKKQFKLSISLSGELIELFELYSPETLTSFKQLVKTNCVEFVCQTYTHSLLFLKNEVAFKDQIEKHAALVKKHFGQTPKTLRLSGQIYSNQLGEKAAELGFTAMLSEGARHVMGWKSPNYLYSGKNNKALSLLLRNPDMSDRVSFDFVNQNLTCENFTTALNGISAKEELVNLFMEYAVFGRRFRKETGIFDFLTYLPEHILATNKFEFLTPCEIVDKHKPIDELNVPYPVSWYEDERDLSTWLGNDLQNDAYTSLCNLATRVRFIGDRDITRDWERLQDADHFYFMCTRKQSDKYGRQYKNPYTSPYMAYANYMNALSDLVLRIDEKVEKKIRLMKKDSDLTEKIEKITSKCPVVYSPCEAEKIIDLVTHHKIK